MGVWKNNSPFTFLNFSGWINNQINVRQINREHDQIYCVQGFHKNIRPRTDLDIEAYMPF